MYLKEHSLRTLHDDRATLYIHRNHKRLGLPFFSPILTQRESNSNNDRFNCIVNLASHMHGEHLDAFPG